MDIFTKFQELKSSLPSIGPENLDVREDLLLEARRLQLALERPDNVVERVCFQVMETITISTAVKMGIFKAMTEGKPSTVQELATATKADPLLVDRLMRTLASFDAVSQKSSEEFELNTVSKTFSLYRNEAALEFCLEFLTPAWMKIPSYLKEINYQTPTNGLDTCMNRAWNQPAGVSTWQILGMTPHGPAGNAYMATFNEGHKDWLDFYPVEERLGKDAKTGSDAVMMVDVGGGLGHQAINLKKKFNLPGKYIVQDFAHVFKGKEDRSVEYQEHDFFTTQPVKGARVYYLRYIPHDWPQETVAKIVGLLKEAMEPGYSRLIVNEWVVPEVKPSKFMMAQDMNMMSLGGGMERTEALHRWYLEKAGLKLNKIYTAGDKISEAVLEAEIA